MALYNKFDIFIADVHNKVHDLSTEKVAVAFTNSLPDRTMNVLGDVTGALDMTNVGTSNQLVVTSSGQVNGTYALIANDLDILATGDLDAGALFRYIVLYNLDTAIKIDPLIAWFDYTTSISLLDAETFTLDFDPTGVFTNT